MAYLEKEDLYSRLYPEIIEQITREDDTIVTRCINSAVNEAKLYLSRFDLLKLFGDQDTEPEVTDPKLEDIIADITVWHLVRLANPNVNIELLRMAYDDAIKLLKDIQAGKADPGALGWPYKADDPDTTFDESTGLQWYSNPKRNQHF